MQTFDTYLDERNVFEFQGEPLMIQSDYFNILFQKKLEDLSDKLDIRNILVNSAQEVAYHQFHDFFKDKPGMEIKARKEFIEQYYSHCGYGKINLKFVQAKGGHVETEFESYGEAWKTWYGFRDELEPGVGYFTMGFLCGSIEALLDVKPGTFDAKQVFCISKGHPFSRFEIFRGLKKKLANSPCMGVEQEEGEHVSDVTGVDGSYILSAIRALKFDGLERNDGYIEVFDRNFTKHYANYFSLVCLKLLMQAEKKLGSGGIGQIKQLIESTAESNAVFLISGLLKSSLWKDKIAPELLGNDAINIVHACLDAISGLGWGKWELSHTDDEEFKVNLINNFETNAYLKLVGNTKAPINYYTGGFLCGLVNLVTEGKAENVEAELESIEGALTSQNKYEYKPEQSRMLGAERDVFTLKL